MTAKKKSFANIFIKVVKNRFGLFDYLTNLKHNMTNGKDNKFTRYPKGARIIYISPNLPRAKSKDILLTPEEYSALQNSGEYEVYFKSHQYYVKNLARGVLGGMVENVRNGISVGSCTFGYMLTPKLDKNGNIVKKYSKTGKAKPVNIYTLHPEHSATVKLIFDMFLAGASRNEILARLKECGYKNSKGGDFKATNIDKILRNERYTSVYILEYNKGKQVNYTGTEVIRNEGGLPKIIDKEDFDKVQQMLNARKHQPNARSLVSYLLTGKIVCGNCGAQFTGSTHYKNGQPYHYYRCGRNNDDCKMISIRKEAIENFVIKEIEKVVKSGEFVASILDRFVEFYKERNNNSEIIKRLEKNL